MAIFDAYRIQRVSSLRPDIELYLVGVEQVGPGSVAVTVDGHDMRADLEAGTIHEINKLYRGNDRSASGKHPDAALKRPVRIERARAAGPIHLERNGDTGINDIVIPSGVE